MKRLLGLVMFCLPLVSQAAAFEETLLVQTGKMTEGDLVVRNVTDLGSSRTCLAFYVKTSGTSPKTFCYRAVSGFGAKLVQVGHIKADDLVIRKIEDTKNGMTCLVAYVSTPGTAPAADCYPSKHRFKDQMVEGGHLREGDLDVRLIADPGNRKSCMVSYVHTKGTDPAVVCYDSSAGRKGGLRQVSQLREGDLVVRKIVDTGSQEACLFSYVSTAGTSSHLYCYFEGLKKPAPVPAVAPRTLPKKQ
ncbi:MAG TPA: hypothetical protein ENK50_06165 [Sedimenticola sp.]|nr:hypothetical protein [Sedimenticola sp.]